MAKTPHFTKVFIIGFLLFIGFYLLVGDSQLFGGPSYRFVSSSGNRSVSEPEISAPDENFVGTKEVEDFRHIPLKTKPFKVSYITEEKSPLKKDELVIENGLLKSNSFNRIFSLTEEELNKMTSTIITGKIDDTNIYGNILMGINGIKIYSEPLSPGDNFEIQINKSLLQERNEFIVTAESSGWRIWAPTVYIIKNLEIKSDYMGEVSQGFDFHVNEDETPVNMGRIILNFDEIEGDGNLIVMLNGKVVFNDTPTISEWIEIENESMITKGKNTIEMASERDTEIIIFWKRDAMEEMDMTLSLSSSQYRKLPGKIRFKIQKIFGTPTSLVATVEDPKGNRHSLVVQGILEEGRTISIELPKRYAGVGKNKIIFSVTGSGGYTISDFLVTL